jgi:transposase-like protein
MVEFVRSGRTRSDLAREFEPTDQTIANWVKRADLDEGVRSDGLKSNDQDELRRLRREVKRFKEERVILKKSRGLVRSGEQCGAEDAFRFVAANQCGGVGSTPPLTSVGSTQQSVL